MRVCKPLSNADESKSQTCKFVCSHLESSRGAVGILEVTAQRRHLKLAAICNLDADCTYLREAGDNVFQSFSTHFPGFLWSIRWSVYSTVLHLYPLNLEVVVSGGQRLTFQYILKILDQEGYGLWCNLHLSLGEVNFGKAVSLTPILSYLW